MDNYAVVVLNELGYANVVAVPTPGEPHKTRLCSRAEAEACALRMAARVTDATYFVVKVVGEVQQTGWALVPRG